MRCDHPSGLETLECHSCTLRLYDALLDKYFESRSVMNELAILVGAEADKKLGDSVAAIVRLCRASLSAVDALRKSNLSLMESNATLRLENIRLQQRIGGGNA